MQASPTDPGSLKPSAGVAVLANRCAMAVPAKARESKCNAMAAKGRLSISYVHVGLDAPVRLYNVYGWTGATERVPARRD
eukprot:13441697-Alexandrium_andersonii.AAC.1